MNITGADLPISMCGWDRLWPYRNDPGDRAPDAFRPHIDDSLGQSDCAGAGELLAGPPSPEAEPAKRIAMRARL